MERKSINRYHSEYYRDLEKSENFFDEIWAFAIAGAYFCCNL